MASIAVVEDEPLLRGLLRDMLTERGHWVEDFDSVKPALDRLSDRPPDLLITDVDLPDGSGLELVARLRDVCSVAFPVIITSALQTEDDYKRGYIAGATDYISKPFRRDELLAKCEVHLARVQSGGTEAIGLGLPGGTERAFQRYRITGTVGRGNSGVVYRATDMRKGGEVALKVLTVMGCAQPEARLRFLREIYALSAVTDPHVVPVYDFGVSEGRFYYAMEAIDGVTVRDKVKAEGAATCAQASRLLAGLARALSAMHESSILHRDISPSNVILRDGRWDQPVLVDFGLAKRTFDHGITHTDLLLGTPGYLDPALVQGEEPCHQGDLFSAGMVVRYALTGEDCFSEYKALAKVTAMTRFPVPIPADLPSPLRGVLTAMTRLELTCRPKDALEVLSSLAA